MLLLYALCKRDKKWVSSLQKGSKKQTIQLVKENMEPDFSFKISQVYWISYVETLPGRARVSLIVL